jgi:hypothetical protein
MTIYDIFPNKTPLKEFIEAFVDDVSLFTNDEFEELNITKILEYLKQDGDLWTGLLQASGGTVEMFLLPTNMVM